MIVCGACVAAPSCTTSQMSTSTPSVGPPPVADKQPKTITVHGDSRVDNYFWLRDKANPKVTEYLRAEDAYADAVMQPTAALRDTLFKEIVGHIKEDDDTAPYRRGDYFYFTRTIRGQQYPIYLRKKGSADGTRRGATGSERAGERTAVHGAGGVHTQR